MVKIKQVASKRPVNREAPLQRAIKSAKSIKAAPQPTILENKPDTISTIKVLQARKSIKSIIPPVEKKIKKMPITSGNRFLLNSIPKRPFQKLVRDLTSKYIQDCRFTRDAIEALHVATEDFLVGYFEDAANCMIHAKRLTLMVKDMELVAKLRKFQYEPL